MADRSETVESTPPPWTLQKAGWEFRGEPTYFIPEIIVREQGMKKADAVLVLSCPQLRSALEAALECLQDHALLQTKKHGSWKGTIGCVLAHALAASRDLSIEPLPQETPHLDAFRRAMRERRTSPG